MHSNSTIAFAAMLTLGAGAALAGETIGIVKRSMGHVVIERGAEQLTPAPGMEIARGDRLITGDDGHVSIAMHGAPSLSVGANTAVPLDRYAADESALPQHAGSQILRSLASFFALNRQR